MSPKFYKSITFLVMMTSQACDGVENLGDNPSCPEGGDCNSPLGNFATPVSGCDEICSKYASDIAYDERDVSMSFRRANVRACTVESVATCKTECLKFQSIELSDCIECRAKSTVFTPWIGIRDENSLVTHDYIKENTWQLVKGENSCQYICPDPTVECDAFTQCVIDIWPSDGLPCDFVSDEGSYNSDEECSFQCVEGEFDDLCHNMCKDRSCDLNGAAFCLESCQLRIKDLPKVCALCLLENPAKSETTCDLDYRPVTECAEFCGE